MLQNRRRIVIGPRSGAAIGAVLGLVLSPIERTHPMLGLLIGAAGGWLVGYVWGRMGLPR